MDGPTTGGLTLVEPRRELAAWQGSVTLTPAGSLVVLEAGSDGTLHALQCAAACGDPATWSDTVLDPGAPWSDPLIRSLDDGTLVAVLDGTSSGGPKALLGFCTFRCSTAGSWSWSAAPLPGDASAKRSPSRYVAVGGGTMILGLGSGAPMSALVCGGACQDPLNWTRIALGNSSCAAPSVAAAGSGAMAFACVTGGSSAGATQGVEVWSCPGDCTSQANWSGVDGLAVGNGLAVDVTVGPGGMVGAAVNLGQQADGSMAGHLGWFQCAGACGEPTSWHGIVVGSEALYGQRVAAVTDQQGRSVIAYDATSSAGSGLLTAACVTDCLKAASWSVALLDDAKRIADQIVVPPPSGCASVSWVPDTVTDITMRGDWAAVSSGYGAIGAGGTCASGQPAPSPAASRIRSVVSVAVLGP
jgi:hypothetical protein